MSGKSELRLFDEVSPQIVINSGVFVDIPPTTSLLDSSSTMEFMIHGSDVDYLDLNDTVLYVKIKATTPANKNIPQHSPNTASNYFLNALFSDITLSLNDTIIEGGNQLYPYKATFENIFGFNKTTRSIQLESMGYDERSEARKNWIAQSRTVEFCGALRLDFLNQNKYLLPGVNVRISMTRSKDSFALENSEGNPKIHILSAKLYVRRVQVNPSVLRGHEKGLLKRNAIYPYTRGQVVSYSIPSGSLSHYRDNVFSSSLLPKFVIVGFVSSDAFNGDAAKKSPFTFDSFNVSSVGLFRDGQSLPFRELYSPDFEGRLVCKDYMRSFIQNTQHLNTNLNNGIAYSSFVAGPYTLFTFNLSPDFDMTQCQAARDGNLRLELKFQKPLPESINVIVYGTFDTQIQITKERNIICSHVH